MAAPSNKGKGAAIAFLRSLIGHTGTECVIWPFAKNHKGYGQLGHEGQSYKANRLMCELAHGKPPSPTHQAAHNCGNGHLSCVNPNHLEWKTNFENQMDRVEHGTMPKKGKPRRILTPEQIQEVRALKGKMAQYDIAKRFGVKPGCIEYWQSHNKPAALLSDDQVRIIRGSQQPVPALARQFGVSRSTIHRVLARDVYRDVA
jgi:DNA-binding transcriptional regulator YiaG